MSSRLPKIKHCPFCGHKASLEEHPQSDKVSNYGVGCDNEDELCVGYQSLTLFATKHEAIAAWNKRYGEAEVEKFQFSAEFKRAFSKMQRTIIVALAEENGTPVTRERLMNKIYKGDERTPAALSALVSATNEKLAPFGTKIFCKQGEYKFTDESPIKLNVVRNKDHESQDT